MTAWQYAQLRVSYSNRLAEDSGRWTIAWHGPDETTQDTAGAYDGVVAELNRAGTEGWELVNVATLNAGDGGRFPDQGDWPLTQYTFRRPYASAPVKSTGLVRQAESPSWRPIGTCQPAGSQDGGLAGSGPTESASLVMFTVFCKPDGISGSDAGRLQIKCEVAHLWSQADIDEIELLRSAYQDHGTGNDRRDEIKAAAADYAASWTEGQFAVRWWETPQRFPLTRAAELLHGSADWLRQLVENPVAGAASRAGIPGPLVPIGAGITANLVTARLTAPLEGAARVFEAAAIVIGLATGTHPLVMASAKLFAHDELNKALSKGFEQIFDSIGAGPKPAARTVGTRGHQVGKKGQPIGNIAPRAETPGLIIRKDPPPGSVPGPSGESAGQPKPTLPAEPKGLGGPGRPYPGVPPRAQPKPLPDPRPRQPDSRRIERPDKRRDTGPGIPGPGSR